MIKKLRALTGIPDLQFQETVQSLWSGFGEIARYYSSSHQRHYVVKQVSPPDKMNHPRGWNSDLSHKRKLHSYAVECYFYQHYGNDLNPNSRVPEAFITQHDKQQFLMVLEDIDAAGFPLRFKAITANQMCQCLIWLAYFHAQYLHHSGEGLWSTGTYWHLATRPDELAKMPDSPLKRHASDIDQKLNTAQFKTLVHGDAKLANFCFGENGEAVAAVDFQYVGKGVGIKDVMLFLGSCMNQDQLFKHHEKYLDFYFHHLCSALKGTRDKAECNALEQEWRGLVPYVWADFHRFLAGWSPEHFKINQFMLAQTEKALS